MKLLSRSVTEDEYRETATLHATIELDQDEPIPDDEQIMEIANCFVVCCFGPGRWFAHEPHISRLDRLISVYQSAGMDV